MTTDITELAQRMKAAAEKASNGDWVKESGDGWEACCSANDQANGGFIIAHFEGPDAAENREFVQAANPANILAVVEALEKAQQVDEELCKLLPPGVEYMDPPDGGDVTPLEGVRRMVADYRQRIAELREWNAGLAQESFERQQCISEIEPIRAAAEKLVRCKGRYHSEQNYRVLAALFGVTTPDLPPLDSESSTVTVKLPQAVSAGGQGYQEQVERILTAAGIKWEAE
ncbi:TPA: ead/Ea22-like family protein [Klebsiella aerogenes]|nr:ead/Ea22-like family protein [Klebsiella aerogenes]